MTFWYAIEADNETVITSSQRVVILIMTLYIWAAAMLFIGE